VNIQSCERAFTYRAADDSIRQSMPVSIDTLVPISLLNGKSREHLPTAGVAHNLRASSLKGKNNSRWHRALRPRARRSRMEEAQSLTSAHTRAIPGGSLSWMVRISSDVGVANGLARCVGSHPPAHSRMHAKSTSNSFGVRALIYARLTLPASAPFRLKVRTRY